MPTPFESAQLILTLFEQRREATMRQARDYFVTDFDPKSFEELIGAFFGPKGNLIRMVVSYWDMAASLVNNGAIDAQMFRDTTGEYILVFGRVEPYLPQIREAFGNPDAFRHLERFTLAMPNARERVDGTVKRFREMMARRAAAATTK